MAVNWNRRSYTKEQFEEAVKTSFSQREVVRKLGQNPDAGGIYYGIKAAIEDLGLDTSHWTGQGWNKGDKMGLRERNTRPFSEILIEDSDYMNTHALKKRLIKAGMLAEKCSACNYATWFNHFTKRVVTIPLSLDHINGIRTDNRIENLRLLCYNCHGLTETYCSKNKAYQNKRS